MDLKAKLIGAKDWAVRNKWKILIGAGLVTATAIVVAVVKRDDDEDLIQGQLAEGSLDAGKDLEMHFVDPETKEVLWKEYCTESYMNDMKDIGMEFEETKELNGIEEA